MDRWRGRIAVVTGASAGIGAAIAYQLLDAGLTVVALARRRDKIRIAIEESREQAAKRGRPSIVKTSSPGKLHCIKCDVTKEEDILAVFKWIKENVGGVDILVNNAGVPTSTKLTETDTADWRRALETNVLGLSICTREAIQQMRGRGVDDGHIIHIGSRCGHGYLEIPGTAIYSSTKHAVRVLTEGLRKELVAAKSHIRVTEVSPGLVQTEITKQVKHLSEVTSAFTDSADLWSIPHLQAEDVAEAVLYAIATPPHVQIHEIIMAAVGEFM